MTVYVLAYDLREINGEGRDSWVERVFARPEDAWGYLELKLLSGEFTSCELTDPDDPDWMCHQDQAWAHVGVTSGQEKSWERSWYLAKTSFTPEGGDRGAD